MAIVCETTIPLKTVNDSQPFVIETEETLGRLPTTCTGIYQEMLIVNYTNFPVAIIDERNTKTIVYPCPEMPYRGTVQIDHRCTGKAREKRTREGLSEFLIPGTRTIIPEWVLASGRHTVEHLNLIFTNECMASQTLHPQSSTTLTNALIEAIMQVCPFNDATTFRYIVNDPKGRVTTMYGCVSDKPVTIYCTNHPDIDADFATLNIILSTPKETFIHNRFNIEPVIATGKMSFDDNELVMSLGLTWEEASQASKTKQRLRDNKIIEFANIRMEGERKEWVEREKRLKLTHEEEMEEAKAEKARLKSKLETQEAINAQLKMQLQSAEAKAAEWQSLYKVQAERAEADEKIRKASAAADSEAIKTAGVVWKIVAGIIVAVAVPLVKHYIASTSTKKE